MPDETQPSGHVTQCRWCDEDVRWNGETWLDVFDTDRCDAPGHGLHVPRPDPERRRQLEQLAMEVLS